MNHAFEQAADGKTPPESWPGWLRLRWSSPLLALDQDGVDFPDTMSNLLGTDLIVGNRACLRVSFLVLLVSIILAFSAQIPRRHRRQIVLLQLFVTLPHLPRHLIQIL